MDILFYLALVTLILLLVADIRAIIGMKSIKHIADIEPLTENQPKVSIIIAALNEEAEIEATVNAALQMDYDNFEVIVVNDRSTDNTGKILDSMSANNERLRVSHITALPAGWLGKNHALQIGADTATGDYLLFTDADAVMESSVLSRAMRYVSDHCLDHLTAVWGLKHVDLLVQTLVFDLTLEGYKYSQPWQAKNPKYISSVGNGKFNLVKTTAYKQCGEHHAMKLCIVDDLRLGLLLKWSGCKQDLVFAYPYIQVDWYTTVAGFIKGVEKWIFAGRNFSVAAVIIESIMYTVVGFFPLVAIFITQGITQALNIIIVLMHMLTFQIIANHARMNVKMPFYSLFSYFVGMAALWNSMFVYLRNNGVTWLGTHYSIADLKKCKLPKFMGNNNTSTAADDSNNMKSNN